VFPAVTDAGPATDTLNELVITIAVALFLEESARLAAVSKTFAGAGKICGAVYVPDESTVPQASPEHPLPETLHIARRSGFPEESTVAVNGRDAPNSTAAVCGETMTEISLVIVTGEPAERWAVSAALVALTDTVAGWGRIAGAVKTPLASIVPASAFPPGMPSTLQFTAVFCVPLTAAENVCVSPSTTDAAAGVTEIEMFRGGGCGGPEPTSPPQPGNDATRSSAARQ
jgi:hypothetical protein